MTLKERLRGLKIYKGIEEVILFFYKYSLFFSKEIITKISRNNKTVKRFLQIFFSQYIIIKGLLSFILEYTIFRIINKIRIKKDNRKEYKYNFAIVAIVKNEAFYLREWIAYYRVVCDNDIHFYIYDNGSTDNTKKTIEDYIKEGFITYIPYEGIEKQLPAYNDSIKKYKDDVRYMAFVDVDEFIVTKTEENLTNHICKILTNNYAGGLGINWKLFGSSGYKMRQEGIVTETFLRHGNEAHWGNTHIKTICNPRFVKKMISPHYPIYKFGFWSIAPNGTRQNLWWNKNVDWSDMAIHHYFCKSLEEYEIKKSRGFADLKGGKYDEKRYVQYDLNNCYDDFMLRYTKQLKELMKTIK